VKPSKKGKAPRQEGWAKTPAYMTRIRGKVDSMLFGEGRNPELHRSPEEVVEATAQSWEETAAYREQRGAHSQARAARKKADFWRSLPMRTARPEKAFWKWADRLRESQWIAEENIDVVCAVDGWSELSLLAARAFFRLLALIEVRNAPQYAEAFLSELTGVIQEFARLANEKPELFQPWARKCAAIPGMVSLNAEKMKDAQDLAKKLQTGEAFPFAILPTGKTGQSRKFKTPANILAERLVNLIEYDRGAICCSTEFPWSEDAQKLEPFSAGISPESLNKWKELSWRILLYATRNKPELDPRVRPLGASAAKKKPRLCKELHEATRSANVRAKIKERLFNAMKPQPEEKPFPR
jgi:hypothetical protein